MLERGRRAAAMEPRRRVSVVDGLFGFCRDGACFARQEIDRDRLAVWIRSVHGNDEEGGYNLVVLRRGSGVLLRGPLGNFFRRDRAVDVGLGVRTKKSDEQQNAEGNEEGDDLETLTIHA